MANDDSRISVIKDHLPEEHAAFTERATEIIYPTSRVVDDVTTIQQNDLNITIKGSVSKVEYICHYCSIRWQVDA